MVIKKNNSLVDQVETDELREQASTAPKEESVDNDPKLQEEPPQYTEEERAGQASPEVETSKLESSDEVARLMEEVATRMPDAESDYLANYIALAERAMYVKGSNKLGLYVMLLLRLPGFIKASVVKYSILFKQTNNGN